MLLKTNVAIYQAVFYIAQFTYETTTCAQCCVSEVKKLPQLQKENIFCYTMNSS